MERLEIFRDFVNLLDDVIVKEPPHCLADVAHIQPPVVSYCGSPLTSPDLLCGSAARTSSLVLLGSSQDEGRALSSINCRTRGVKTDHHAFHSVKFSNTYVLNIL